MSFSRPDDAESGTKVKSHKPGLAKVGANIRFARRQVTECRRLFSPASRKIDSSVWIRGAGVWGTHPQPELDPNPLRLRCGTVAITLHLPQIFEPSLDLEPRVDQSVSVKFALLGAYWFRPGGYVRGGMPRMVRWPRKSPDQKITATQELALAA